MKACFVLLRRIGVSEARLPRVGKCGCKTRPQQRWPTRSIKTTTAKKGRLQSYKMNGPMGLRPRGRTCLQGDCSSLVIESASKKECKAGGLYHARTEKNGQAQSYRSKKVRQPLFLLQTPTHLRGKCQKMKGIPRLTPDPPGVKLHDVLRAEV